MMLTVKQPAHYGYKSVHDLPTPPSTSRPSPPLIFQDPSSSHKPLPAIPRSRSPSSTAGQPMSAPHRGLPPPAAMTLPPQPPSVAGHPPPPPPGPSSLGPAQLPPHALALGQLPAPPPQWQGAEESMRNWLAAKSEEERRRQEEEKTRQESLRLDQRKIEFEQSKVELEQKRVAMDILRTSISSGIPPPLVPVVFAGMGAVAGGTLPQAALEWAHQFMPQPPGHHQQLLPPQGQVSSEQRRDSQSQAYGPYGTVPSTPGSAPGPGGYSYPGSPTRGRGHSMSVANTLSRPAGQGPNLPGLNTNVPPSGGPATAQAPQGHGSAQPQSAPPQHQHQQHQEAQASPGLYFHHWHPPTSQAGSSSNQPATPSDVVGELPRKRKAVGPPPTTQQQRLRSPPFGQHGSSTLSNPPPGRRRGHSRQRSDLSAYRPSVRGRSEGLGPYRGLSPAPLSPGTGSGTGPSSRDGETSEPAQQVPRSAGGGPLVSSLLSEEPPARRGGAAQAAAAAAYLSSTEAHREDSGGHGGRPSQHVHHHQQQQHQQHQQHQARQARITSPPMDDHARGGAAGSAATRQGE